MSTNQAIIISALVLSFSLFWSSSIGPARASVGGPYQLMRHSNPNVNVGVFRLDTASGEVSYCFLTPRDELVCSQGVK